MPTIDSLQQSNARLRQALTEILRRAEAHPADFGIALARISGLAYEALNAVDAPELEKPMQPFKRVEGPAEHKDVRTLITKYGMSKDAAVSYAETASRADYFLNDTYQVIRRYVLFGLGDQPMAHLSIKRRDKQPVHDWRDFQQIKNLLVGPENEGLEIFPAESRLVDTSNQYHLWVFAFTETRLPIGFADRLVMDADQASKFGATQR